MDDIDNHTDPDTYPPGFLDSPFMNGYVTCLLWCSIDADPEDDSDDPFMVELDKYPEAPDLRDKLAPEAWDFYSEFREFWGKAGWTDDHAGHDFALTRNHHGTGFWDRGHGEAGAALTEAAQAYGETNLYIIDGVDGWEVTA